MGIYPKDSEAASQRHCAVILIAALVTVDNVCGL